MDVRMTEDLEAIREFIARSVKEGFDSVHDIVESATHYAYEVHNRDAVRSVIKQMTAELVAAHRSEQTEWEASTDCDRLNSAFAELNRRGIVARQNFSCCVNCGFTEIWDEVDQDEKQHPVIGYVFYTVQSTEHVIMSGQLQMAYGSIEEDESVLRKVANSVVAELRRAGLNAAWGGTTEHPIVVEGIVWRRRR